MFVSKKSVVSPRYLYLAGLDFLWEYKEMIPWAFRCHPRACMGIMRVTSSSKDVDSQIWTIREWIRSLLMCSNAPLKSYFESTAVLILLTNNFCQEHFFRDENKTITE